MQPVTLGVALVFYDWQGSVGKSVSSKDYKRLSTGSLHVGTKFQVSITLDENAAEDLMDALNAGFQPVFWMTKRTVAP